MLAERIDGALVNGWRIGMPVDRGVVVGDCCESRSWSTMGSSGDKAGSKVALPRM